MRRPALCPITLVTTVRLVILIPVDDIIGNYEYHTSLEYLI